MKKILLILPILFASFISLAGNDEPEVVGENLDLTAVLNLFEKSESVEDFENQLNSEKNDINNLDLNEDGYVDYIRVIDYADGNTHSLTLQVPYSDGEAQDVAVIYIEEEGENTSVQIVGDEDLYGDEFIVEPGDEKNNTVVNAYNWRPVRHMYSPRYTVWVSPWRWGVYPQYYRPWRPVTWSVYRGRVRHHRVPCRRVRVYRSYRAHSHYHKHRVHSHTFHVHHHKGVKTNHKSVTNKNKNTQKKSATKNKNKSTKKQNATNKKQQTNKRKSSQKKNQGTMKSSRSTGKPTKRPGGNRGGGQRRN